MHRNAADLMVRQAVYEFVSAFGAAACVMLVSGDTGFADVLAFCRSRGCRTILVGRCRSSQLQHAQTALPVHTHSATALACFIRRIPAGHAAFDTGLQVALLRSCWSQVCHQGVFLHVMQPLGIL